MNIATQILDVRFFLKARGRHMLGLIAGAALLALLQTLHPDLPRHEPDKCQTVTSDDRGIHLQLAQPVTPTMAVPPACVVSPSIQIVR
jgi:hypothetical protein